MFIEDRERDVRRLEEQFERELEELSHQFPHHRYHRKHDNNKILFLFTFSNLQILAPMSLKKVIGAFSGTLVFKNVEGQVRPITGLTGLVLSVNDATIGNAALALDDSGNPTGAYSGNGIALGDLVITATGLNDAGKQETGSTTITFVADTTVTEIDVLVDEPAAAQIAA